MKIILSRKGFDLSCAGFPSPIIDDTLLSMPIPEDTSEWHEIPKNAVRYRDLSYSGRTYDQIIEGLRPKCRNPERGINFDICHLDPDIRRGIRLNPIDGWKPAFGQTGNALSILEKAGVEKGDLFLFFGLFRKAEERDGSIKFIRNERPKHIIYGYMQIDKILKRPEDMAKYNWHPHAISDNYDSDNNALFLPSDELSSLSSPLPGHGVLSYREDRVLTIPGKSAAVWKEHYFLRPENIIGNWNYHSKDCGLYYNWQWQELILNGNKKAQEWVMGLIR